MIQLTTIKTPDDNWDGRPWWVDPAVIISVFAEPAGDGYPLHTVVWYGSGTTERVLVAETPEEVVDLIVAAKDENGANLSALAYDTGYAAGKRDALRECLEAHGK